MGFASDLGSVASFGLEDFVVAGVRVAPAEVLADGPGEGRVIAMVTVSDHELA